MSRFLLLSLALVACKNDPTPTEDPTPTDEPTPTEEPVPTEEPEPSCTDPSIALTALDVAGAHADYVTCLSESPEDVDLALGEVLTDFLLLMDDPTLAGLVTDCGEIPPDHTVLFGDEGLLREQERFLEGTFSLTTAEILPEGGPAEPYDLFPTAPAALMAYDYGAVDADICDDVRCKREFAVRVDDFLYDLETSESTLVQAGTVVTLEGDDAGFGVRVYGPCRDGSSGCSWSADEEGSSGTITVNTVSSFGTVAFDFDVTLSSYASPEQVHLVGSFSDQPYDDTELLDSLPFVDFAETSRALEETHWRTAALSAFSEACPDVAIDDVYARARTFRTRLDDLATRLEATDQGAAFVVPQGVLTYLFTDLSVNQADALALAAGLRALSASLAFGSSYDVLSPTATGSSRLGHYTVGYMPDDGTETCVDEPYWGVSVATQFTELDENLLNLRADQQLVEARAALTAMAETTKAALESTPAQPGFLRPAGDPLHRNDALADVQAVLDSLNGTDGPMAFDSSVRITLDAFFAAPTTRSGLETLAGTELFTSEYGQCGELDYYVSSDAMVETLRADNGIVPLDEIDPDTVATPSYLDGDTYPDDIPAFFGETVDWLEAMYGETYYDAP